LPLKSIENLLDSMLKEAVPFPAEPILLTISARIYFQVLPFPLSLFEFFDEFMGAGLRVAVFLVVGAMRNFL